MPFYLALPRPATFSGKTQGGSMTKTDYIRSAPSSVLYQLATGYPPEEDARADRMKKLKRFM
jgi:hypothetical protein